MKTNSLSLRLLLAASLSILLALFATGLAFGSFFKTYFEDRIRSELATHLQQLTANIEIDALGQFIIYPLSDQRFDQPFSGLYWQIDPADTKPLHSRSLWDLTLELQRPATLGTQQSQRVSTAGFDLMVLSWVVTIGGDDNPTELMLSVAAGYDQIQATAEKFNQNLALWLSILAGALIFAGWLQVRIGLRPLEVLAVEISKIRDGSSQQIPGDVPSEVAPLVAEVNQLLHNQQKSLAQARSRAGDLAHGLKTPLTVMRALAQQLRTGDTAGLAQNIDAQVDAMAHFVDRELARSRMGANLTDSVEMLPVISHMVASISKLPSERKINWHIDVAEGLNAPFDRFNFSELLGNLLDNAREWTNDRITVSASLNGDQTVLKIQDNGPGVKKSMLSAILQRGNRVLESRNGNGLGLAIVQDLATAHNCQLTLTNSAEGGLIVTLGWQS